MDRTADAMVTEARTRIRSLSPAEVEAQLLTGEVVVIDVREAEELDEHGSIAGAYHVPRGLLEFRADPSSPLHRPELDPQRSTIVYSAGGSRSALAAETLTRLDYRDVSHLDGGIVAWKRCGLPVVGLASWHRISRPRR